MDPNYSKFFGYENFQSTITNLAPQTNYGQSGQTAQMNVPYMPSVQHANIHSLDGGQEVYPHQAFQLMTNNSSVVQPVYHPTAFFYQPPNDLYYYRIKCKEISTQLLNECMNFNQNEYVFFYQQYDSIYRIACEVVSPISIMNKTVYGIELEWNIRQEQLTFTFDQKEKLQRHLTQYLSRYLLN
jgi:hypothetical protein